MPQKLNQAEQAFCKRPAAGSNPACGSTMHAFSPPILAHGASAGTAGVVLVMAPPPPEMAAYMLHSLRRLPRRMGADLEGRRGGRARVQLHRSGRALEMARPGSGRSSLTFFLFSFPYTAKQ